MGKADRPESCVTINPMETPKLSGKEKREKNLAPQWKKGDPSPNPEGRPLGQRNYATIYKAALKKIAESQNMTPEEFEDLMLQSGLKNALKDYRFYKDTNDRLHGTPKQNLELSGTGEDGAIEVRVKMV